MKKILIALGIVVIGIAAVSAATTLTKEPKFTVINQSSKASPAGVFAQAVRQAVDGQWYQSSNCTDATAKFNSTKDAVMVYNSSVAFAALNKKLEGCQLDEIAKSNSKVALISSSRMLICQRAESNTDLFAGEKLTLGMASMYAVPKHEAQWQASGSAVKIVPYSGSKTVLQALIAGDIDWGWMGESLALKQGDKLKCEYSTDPLSTKFLGKKTPKLVIADFRIIAVVYSNTANVEKLKTLLTDSKSFQKYLKSSKNEVENVLDEKLVDQYVQRMYNAWAD
jgi:hypothetical protein